MSLTQTKEKPASRNEEGEEGAGSSLKPLVLL
jgi:hypothetical protein